MLVVRILSGPQANQIYQLPQGKTVIGRTSSADLKIANKDISKEHAQIELLSDKVIITDLNSTNGTFVNGIKIRSHRLKPDDKISLFKVLIEVCEVPDIQPQPVPSHNPQVRSDGYPSQSQSYSVEPIYNQQAAPNIHMEQHQIPYHQDSKLDIVGEADLKKLDNSLYGKFTLYVEKVVLPGVYKLPEILEFKWVLGIMMIVFIILVTSLSSIPLVRILKESIEKESQRRALTIARSLSNANRMAIMNGQNSVVTVEAAERETGVSKAFIVKSSDGSIIAPTRLSGQFPDEAFLHVARKSQKESVSQIDSSTIGAISPIKYYNPNTGNQSVQAFAVVFYDMGSLAIDDSRTLSLLIQTFFIALLIGALLFFFIYKMIEHPLINLNKQMDQALKDGSDQISINYIFPALNDLTTNLSSALTRILTGGNDNGEMNIEYDRNMEMTNLAHLMGFPTIVILAEDRTIGTFNDAFGEKNNLNINDYMGAPLSSITDQSLKLSLEDLVERSIETPHQLATNELDISGINHEIAAQSIYGLKSVSYVLISFIPLSEEGYE